MQEGARVDWFPGKVVVLKTPIFLVLRGPRLTTEALKVLLSSSATSSLGKLSRTSCRTSLGEERSGCLARHHRWRW